MVGYTSGRKVPDELSNFSALDRGKCPTYMMMVFKLATVASKPFHEKKTMIQGKMSHQNKRIGQYPGLKVTFLQTPACSQITPA